MYVKIKLEDLLTLCKEVPPQALYLMCRSLGELEAADAIPLARFELQSGRPPTETSTTPGSGST